MVRVRGACEGVRVESEWVCEGVRVENNGAMCACRGY